MLLIYRSLPVLPLETEDIDLDRLYSRISSALLEATADTFMSGGVTEQWVAHTDSSIRGILFTLLHCVSQAIVNMIIKQLVDIPKTKLAFYAAFGLLVGHMPEGFALENPLAERQLQVTQDALCAIPLPESHTSLKTRQSPLPCLRLLWQVVFPFFVPFF